MTDNEIIKALECCNGYDCETCRALKYCDYMHPGALARASLDLINRQKEKIKEFDEKLVIRRGLIDYQKAEIEQWKEEANKYQNLWCIAVDDIEKVKSEAIKEFAERLKENCYTYSDICGYQSTVVDVNHINNLVKEMAE